MLPFKYESHTNSETMQLTYIGSEAKCDVEGFTAFSLHSLNLGCSQGERDKYLLQSDKGKVTAKKK